MAAQAAPGTKAARQARIAAILAHEQVHSQEQLAGLLAQYTGMHVTQATLSRDLDELGVVRLRSADGALVYALPGDPGGHGSRAGTSLGGPSVASPSLADTGIDHPERADPGASPAAAGKLGTGRSGTGRSGTGKAAPGGSDPGGSHSGKAASGQVADVGPVAGQGAGDAVAATVPGTVSRDAAGTAPSPARAGGASPRLVRYLKELLTSAEASANLVVLRTPAGAAQFLASAIDHTAWPAILGTVAGDDTVLVITRDPTGGEALAEYFRRLAEGRR